MVSTVSISGAASRLSRATRSRYETGGANGGTVPAVNEKVGVIDVRGPVSGIGASATMPSVNTAAAATSGRPQPLIVSGLTRLVATFRNAVRRGMGRRAGYNCLTSAADAASSGVANDVPSSRRTWPFPVTVQTATPGAVKSGLIRPSAVGPREENTAILPSESSAPAASTESPSAGVQIEREPGPLFPAAVTTRMPRCAAMSAATVVTATSPFNSDGV